MKNIVVLNDQDNVATSLLALEPNVSIQVHIDGVDQTIVVRDEIAFGHKIAIRPMAPGDEVLKYGEVIGKASQAIAPGEWVHIHNIESARARGDIAGGASS
jgi:altronate dehydratase small subunit